MTTKTEVITLPRIGGTVMVTLFRVNKSRVPSDVYKDSVTKVGSEWKSETRDVLRGLTPAEEKILLPTIIGIEPSSPNWDSKTAEYWADFSLRVPDKGLEFNIWQGENGLPSIANVKDWIAYKFCKVSSKVAVSEDEYSNRDIYPFYVEDNKELIKQKTQKLAVRKEADLEFLKLFKEDKAGKVNTLKVNWVMEMYKKHDSTLGKYRDMTNDIKEIYIDEQREKDADVFLSIVKDDKLEERAFISECVSLGYINHVGNAYYNGDEKIGDNMDDSILYLRDAKHSSVLLSLKERVKQASPIEFNTPPIVEKAVAETVESEPRDESVKIDPVETVK
jgi:hypothetical protein